MNNHAVNGECLTTFLTQRPRRTITRKFFRKWQNTFLCKNLFSVSRRRSLIGGDIWCILVIVSGAVMISRADREPSQGWGEKSRRHAKKSGGSAAAASSPKLIDFDLALSLRTPHGFHLGMVVVITIVGGLILSVFGSFQFWAGNDDFFIGRFVMIFLSFKFKKVLIAKNILLENSIIFFFFLSPKLSSLPLIIAGSKSNAMYSTYVVRLFLTPSTAKKIYVSIFFRPPQMILMTPYVWKLPLWRSR